MGFLDGTKAKLKANRAYQAHIKANQAADAGHIADAKQKYAEALSMYEEARQLGCKRANILQAYAVLLMREGQLDKAREVMLEIEKIKGLTADDWFNLRLNYSICQWKLGQLDKAIETVRRAGRERMSGGIYNTLGMFLVDKAQQTGDFEEALAFNLEALEYDDEDPATLDNLGQLYGLMAQSESEKGNADQAADYRKKARDYMLKAHKLKPRQITTIYYLAQMCREDGEIDRARALVNSASDIYFSALCPVSRERMDALAAELAKSENVKN